MASVSLRCHGLGAIGRWTVAADESRRAWVVPLFGAQGTSKTDAPELKLTTYEVATRLVAKKPVGSQIQEQNSAASSTSISCMQHASCTL